MLLLYDLPISSYGCKTRILLRHKGVEWTRRAPPDGYGSQAYCKIVPTGTIPALDHDGFIIAESEAIAEYLNEIVPTPAMLPADMRDRAAARALSRIHDGRIEPVLRSFFGQLAPATRNTAFINENATLLQIRLNQLASMIAPAPFLTGSDLSLADCGFAPSFAILHCLQKYLAFSLDLPAVLAKYEIALSAHPSVRDEYAAYVATLNEWAAAKLA